MSHCILATPETMSLLITMRQRNHSGVHLDWRQSLRKCLANYVFSPIVNRESIEEMGTGYKVASLQPEA